jgi:hypothetical protein
MAQELIVESGVYTESSAVAGGRTINLTSGIWNGKTPKLIIWRSARAVTGTANSAGVVHSFGAASSASQQGCNLVTMADAISSPSNVDAWTESSVGNVGIIRTAAGVLEEAYVFSSFAAEQFTLTMSNGVVGRKWEWVAIGGDDFEAQVIEKLTASGAGAHTEDVLTTGSTFNPNLVMGFATQAVMGVGSAFGTAWSIGFTDGTSEFNMGARLERDVAGSQIATSTARNNSTLKLNSAVADEWVHNSFITNGWRYDLTLGSATARTAIWVLMKAPEVEALSGQLSTSIAYGATKSNTLSNVTNDPKLALVLSVNRNPWVNNFIDANFTVGHVTDEASANQGVTGLAADALTDPSEAWKWTIDTSDATMMDRDADTGAIIQETSFALQGFPSSPSIDTTTDWTGTPVANTWAAMVMGAVGPTTTTSTTTSTSTTTTTTPAPTTTTSTTTSTPAPTTTTSTTTTTTTTTTTSTTTTSTTTTSTTTTGPPIIEPPEEAGTGAERACSSPPVVSGSFPPIEGSSLTTTTTFPPEPGPANLPDQLNPLCFLVENVWRDNATIVRIDVTNAASGVGFRNATVLRRMLPPWKLLVILFELSISEETVTLSEHTSEGVTTFGGAEPITESVNLSDLVTEQVTVKQVQGVCG